MFGAYVAGVGVNSVVPARGGDVVKLYLVKQRLRDASYATLAPTLDRRDAVRRRRRVGAPDLGALARRAADQQVYSRIPTVDWGFFITRR